MLSTTLYFVMLIQFFSDTVHYSYRRRTECCLFISCNQNWTEYSIFTKSEHMYHNTCLSDWAELLKASQLMVRNSSNSQFLLWSKQHHDDGMSQGLHVNEISRTKWEWQHYNMTFIAYESPTQTSPAASACHGVFQKSSDIFCNPSL